jgi:hypothetical protein
VAGLPHRHDPLSTVLVFIVLTTVIAGATSVAFRVR